MNIIICSVAISVVLLNVEIKVRHTHDINIKRENYIKVSPDGDIVYTVHCSSESST